MEEARKAQMRALAEAKAAAVAADPRRITRAANFGALVRATDTDGDGSISKEEFMVYRGVLINTYKDEQQTMWTRCAFIFDPGCDREGRFAGTFGHILGTIMVGFVMSCRVIEQDRVEESVGGRECHRASIQLANFGDI